MNLRSWSALTVAHMLLLIIIQVQSPSHARRFTCWQLIHFHSCSCRHSVTIKRDSSIFLNFQGWFREKCKKSVRPADSDSLFKKLIRRNRTSAHLYRQVHRRRPEGDCINKKPFQHTVILTYSFRINTVLVLRPSSNNTLKVLKYRNSVYNKTVV